MKKIITKKKIENTEDNYKEFLRNKFKNQIILDFIKENKIPLKIIIKYMAELILFEKNNEYYQLVYKNEEIILERKITKTNKGITYIDQEYFYENKDLNNINHNENQHKAKIITHFLENTKKSMYIYSDNGVGKTTLVVALANANFQLKNEKTLFVFWPEFIEQTKRFGEKNFQYINQVKYSKRLIIDDLGQESISNWGRDDILHPIISYRLEKRLPTYITSNYTTKELEELYMIKKTDSKKVKSIIQKLKNLCDEFYIDGQNLREEK